MNAARGGSGVLRATTAAAVRARVREWRAAGARIALVPTMGNLHRGHLALIARAAGAAERVAVSLFVNPLQFDRAADLAAYPRTEESDLRLLKEHRVDLAFAPPPPEICPPASSALAAVTAGPLAAGLCGAYRRGHFDGVAVIVASLFDLFRPHVAVFGEKDYQQLCIVRDLAARLGARLGYVVDVVAVPTVRAADGLALSSRNACLTPQQRCAAPALYRTLQWLAARIGEGREDVGALGARASRRIAAAGLRPEYVEVRHPRTLAPPRPDDKTLIVLAAAWLGKARLIDNVTARRP